MDRWASKVAIVTGASAGIGAAIAVKLAENGLKVVGLARRSEKVEELNRNVKGQKVGKIYGHKCDLGVEQDILNSWKWIKDNIGDPHVLVNNAGLGTIGKFIDTTTEDWKSTYDVNIVAVAVLTREFIKHTAEKNIDGHVIAISSITAGYGTVMPGVNAATTSKLALQALQEVVRQELAQTKSRTKISTICPGATESERSKESSEKRAAIFNIDPKNIPRMKAEDVADAVLFALATPLHVEIRQVILKAIS